MADHEHFATKCARRYPVQQPVHPVAPPIISSSTYVLESVDHGARLCVPGGRPAQLQEGESRWLYARYTKLPLVDPSDFGQHKINASFEVNSITFVRWASPTNDVAARAVTAIEGGHASFVTSSGMAAVSLAILGLLKNGDHIIAPKAVYGGAHEFLTQIVPNYGIEVTFVDASDVSNYEVEIRPNTKVLYGETPANPTLTLLDLKAFGDLGKKHNLITIIDSTFASPYNQRPLESGISIVIHSATKYLGGHSDLIAGTLTCSTQEIFDKLNLHYRLFGSALSAFDSFLLARGIKTLDMRMERHNKNALAIAEFLEKHPKVEKVYYPGLKSHSQHELAKRQMRGFGGMIAFEVKGGVQAGQIMIESVKCITLAVSLGGIESLIEHAASMTHANVSREERMQGGINDGLIRLSVGLEDVRDLLQDLEQALEKI